MAREDMHLSCGEAFDNYVSHLSAPIYLIRRLASFYGMQGELEKVVLGEDTLRAIMGHPDVIEARRRPRRRLIVRLLNLLQIEVQRPERDDLEELRAQLDLPVVIVVREVPREISAGLAVLTFRDRKTKAPAKVVMIHGCTVAAASASA